MPGTIPATSQLDGLISMTAINVLAGSRVMRDRLKSFNVCMGSSIGSQRTMDAISTPPPHSIFHHGIRGRGGTIFGATLPDGRSKRTCELTSSIVPRGTLFHRLVELEFPPIAFDPERLLGRRSFSGPSEFSAINPDAMHNHGQPSSQCNDCLFHPAVPGNLHRPGLEPRPFCRT